MLFLYLPRHRRCFTSQRCFVYGLLFLIRPCASTLVKQCRSTSSHNSVKFFKNICARTLICAYVNTLVSCVFKVCCHKATLHFSFLASLLLLSTVLTACQSPPKTHTVSNVSTIPLPSLADQQALMTELADWSKQKSDVSGATALPSTQAKPVVKERYSVHLVNARADAVLLTLANEANLELQLHQPIDELVTLLAKERTLVEMLNQIARQITLHWQLLSGVLHVWGAAPFSETYAVNYLNIDRSTRSVVGLATQVGTINSVNGSVAQSASNSSQTVLQNSSEHQFWQSLAADIDNIVKRESNNASYSVNRDAGLVTLFAPVSLHQVLKAYLDRVNESARRQVLIEATVVEVSLSDQFAAGIDWQLLSDGMQGISATQQLSGSPTVSSDSVDRIAAPNALFSLVQKTKLGHLSATLNLLQQFGDVRILSKPRIIALNNQSSVLKVVDNRVYFTVNVERQRSENSDEVITETEIHTVPVGLVMNVTPFVNADGDVMLNVRPTLSRILGFVNDPNPELAAANVRNSVPEIQVREMESMLRVKSGDMAIIGGLMQDTIEDTSQSVPGVATLPIFGRFFKQQNVSRRQTELLIVLKPTVISSPEIRRG